MVDKGIRHDLYDSKILSKVLGEHGNAWNGEEPEAHGFSNPIDTKDQKNISVFGEVWGSTTITAWVSQNGEKYYHAPFITALIEIEEALTDYPDWSAEVNYKKGQIVEHEVEAEDNLYICIKTHKNIEPGVHEDWEDHWELYAENLTENGDYPNFFSLSTEFNGRFIMLQSSASVEITATIVSKF